MRLAESLGTSSVPAPEVRTWRTAFTDAGGK